MKFRWILLILFLLILSFQSKNILTFVGVELGKSIAKEILAGKTLDLDSSTKKTMDQLKK